MTSLRLQWVPCDDKPTANAAGTIMAGEREAIFRNQYHGKDYIATDPHRPDPQAWRRNIKRGNRLDHGHASKVDRWIGRDRNVVVPGDSRARGISAGHAGDWGHVGSGSKVRSCLLYTSPSPRD